MCFVVEGGAGGEGFGPVQGRVAHFFQPVVDAAGSGVAFGRMVLLARSVGR